MYVFCIYNKCRLLDSGIFCRYNLGMAKASKKATRGRPGKAPAEKRSAVLQVRLTEAERTLLEQAAQVRGADTSTWVRLEVLALAKQIMRNELG